MRSSDENLRTCEADTEPEPAVRQYQLKAAMKGMHCMYTSPCVHVTGESGSHDNFLGNLLEKSSQVFDEYSVEY
jgi:hypothetical protein